MRALGLLFGTAFGFVLAGARLHEPEVIHAMLALEDLEPFWFMGSAMAVALPALWLLERRRWVCPLGGRLVLGRARPQRHHLVGGVVFGLGWAVAGTCPAPAIVMVGTGAGLGLVAAAGIFAGIVARDAAVARPSSVPDDGPASVAPAVGT